MSNIEGIPEGWELVRIGKVKPGECWLDSDGIVIHRYQSFESEGSNYVIIKRIPKPKQYRPFANAAEYKPHRDRWLARIDEHGLLLDGEFQINGFDDTGIWLGSNHLSYKDALDQGHAFDDGNPFGVEVTE